ncbi:MAG: efflux RND transporter periplasmic adaptor subunit [Gammaproteobacteria bacterium]|nr:efflux RND transporter periplasmic adaptor subunit [Gammaproteobacteria bacterium]
MVRSGAFHFYIPLAGVVLVLIGSGLLAAEVRSEDDVTPDFRTAVVQRKLMPTVYVAEAVIEAVQQATLAAETTGRIKQIMFDVDDVVVKGALLLRFTDKQQRAGLARAEANLKAAVARQREAHAEYDRMTSVYAKKLVARAALDKAIADFKAANERVKAGEADVKQAREQLEYTMVRAPYGGIVTQRHVSVGERVRPGTALMTGYSLAKLRATASVPQSLVEAVRRHGRVSIYLDSTPDSPRLESDKLTVYPYADPASHSFTVRVALTPAAQGYYPGMFAKAEFVVGERSRLLAPAAAVVHRGEVTAVYVVDKNGDIGFRAVRLGEVFPGGQREVLAGLDEGEQVALNPVAAGVRLKQQRINN